MGFDWIWSIKYSFIVVCVSTNRHALGGTGGKNYSTATADLFEISRCAAYRMYLFPLARAVRAEHLCGKNVWVVRVG